MKNEEKTIVQLARTIAELMRFLHCPENYVSLEHFEQIRNRAFADKTERKVFINEKV